MPTVTTPYSAAIAAISALDEASKRRVLAQLIAELAPTRKADKSRLAARHFLFERLRENKTIAVGSWARKELYD